MSHKVDPQSPRERCASLRQRRGQASWVCCRAPGETGQAHGTQPYGGVAIGALLSSRGKGSPDARCGISGLEDAMLSERGQTREATYRTISLV